MLNKLKKIAGKGTAFIIEHVPHGNKPLIAYLNSQIKDYGEVLDFRFNKVKKMIHLIVDLHGEEKSLELKIEDFHLKHSEELSSITLNSISCDKLWLQNLLKKVTHQKDFEIPKEISPIVEGLLS